MKKCFCLFFISIATLSFSQNKQIHTYKNETEFYFFDGNKVIFINAIGYCFQEANSLPIKVFRKRIRKFKRRLKFFTKGKITASKVYELFPENRENTKRVDFNMVENNLSKHKEALVDYLAEQGFYVLNFWQYIERPDAVDVQYHLGSQMDCIFYNFKIIKKGRSVELVKGDSGLTRIWE
jgi:hypothetical protein